MSNFDCKRRFNKFYYANLQIFSILKYIKYGTIHRIKYNVYPFILFLAQVSLPTRERNV